IGFWLLVSSENQMLSAWVMVRPDDERDTSPTLKSSRKGPLATRGMLVRDLCSPGRTRTSNLLITRSPRFPSDVDYRIALARSRARFPAIHPVFTPEFPQEAATIFGQSAALPLRHRGPCERF